MKKMFLVLAVVMVGSLAANAKVFNFSFDGFCDNITSVRNSPSPGVIPAVFVHGVHHLIAPCGGAFDSNVGGFKHGKSSTFAPFISPVDDYSDPIEGLYGFNYSLQYLVHEPNAAGGCLWANYFSNGVGLYVFNSGTCTTFAGAAPQKRMPGSSSVKR